MVHNIGPVSIEWDSANNQYIIQHPDGSTITLDATGVQELVAQAAFNSHTGDTSNPHSVTASQASAAPDPHDNTAHSSNYYSAGDDPEFNSVGVTQSASNAYLSVQQSIAPSTFTKVELDTAEFDHLNAFDATTNGFAVDAGQYAVSASARFGNSESGIRVIVQIQQNGTDVYRADSHAAVSQTVSAVGSTTVDAAAGDTIEMFAWHNASTSMDLRNGVNETSFQINRIG